MTEQTEPQLSRRGVLIGGAAAGLAGAGIAVGIADAVRNGGDGAHSASSPSPEAALALGESTIPFYGEHQAGIVTEPQAHATFIALDLNQGVGRDGVRRLMRILTDDAARMTQGRTALADMEAELNYVPANLTVTFGFGPGLVAAVGGSGPDWLQQLPAFSIDRLEPQWSEGDLLIKVASDDALTVAHTSRMMLKDARSFATPRWSQAGFRRAAGALEQGSTMRNMFGQVDGTVNPASTAQFDEMVWSQGGWMTGGTSLVIRRIHMNLDKWDRLDRSGREQTIGRNLANGAPLTGVNETDEPDFEAKSSNGFTTIADFAHIRRARGDGSAPQILRQPYNYAEAPTVDSVSDAGQIFTAYQADMLAQFLPIQQRLDQLDLLNQWTTPIGSAVFALPPGCEKGGYIGETLLEG